MVSFTWQLSVYHFGYLHDAFPVFYLRNHMEASWLANLLERCREPHVTVVIERCAEDCDESMLLQMNFLDGDDLRMQLLVPHMQVATKLGRIWNNGSGHHVVIVDQQGKRWR